MVLALRATRAAAAKMKPRPMSHIARGKAHYTVLLEELDGQMRYFRAGLYIRGIHTEELAVLPIQRTVSNLKTKHFESFLLKIDLWRKNDGLQGMHSIGVDELQYLYLYKDRKHR